jgi:hypothetical protein
MAERLPPRFIGKKVQASLNRFKSLINTGFQAGVFSENFSGAVLTAFLIIPMWRPMNACLVRDHISIDRKNHWRRERVLSCGSKNSGEKNVRRQVNRKWEQHH